MNATKLLQPAPGLKVRHPDGRHLDPAGELIEMSAYWFRRLAAGDVVEAAPPAPAKAPKAKPAEGKEGGDAQGKRAE